jgi:hypothetical protein
MVSGNRRPLNTALAVKWLTVVLSLAAASLFPARTSARIFSTLGLTEFAGAAIALMTSEKRVVFGR